MAGDDTCTLGGDDSCDVLSYCEGWSARWCAVHGDCTCPYDDGRGWGPGVFDEPYDDACPLHGFGSNHGDAP